MSSGNDVITAAPRDQSILSRGSEQDRFIEARLLEARRHVKAVDVATALVTLAIGVLAYLLTTALIDHWLVTGGLGTVGRMLMWLGLVVGGGAYFAWRVWPPLWHRINPVFAASTIERSEPTLRNSLINFLLLRRSRQEMAPAVYQALEGRAAADLARVKVEIAVDRSHLVRLGCVLAAVMILFGVYIVASPKNPLRSAVRVLFPWAAIEPPTRVTIRDVEPGDKVAFLGDTLTIAADVAGLRDGEVPSVIYSTADGQTVEQAVPMSLPAGGYRYQASFPPGSLGLQQDYYYFLAAGDARSRRYRIGVQVAPTITVDKAVYHYPTYTGIPDRTVERGGDLAAIEGTQITLYASANTEIKPGSAEIDLGATGRAGRTMKVDGRMATGNLTLRLQSDGTAKPEYDAYQLRFRDLQGRENVRPIRHRIDVVRDLPPDVLVLAPEAKEVQVAEDGKLDIRLRAEDPDFGLRGVMLRAERDGRGLLIDPLLTRVKPEKPVPGEYLATYTFTPSRWGLKAGDEIQYWVEAEDNKEPVANRTASEKRWIKIVARDGKEVKEQGNEGAQGQDDRQDQQRRGQKSPDQRDGQRDRAEQDHQDGEGSTQQSPDNQEQGKNTETDGAKGKQGEPGQNQRGEPNRDQKPDAQREGDQQSPDKQSPDNGAGEERGNQQPRQGEKSPQQDQKQDGKQAGDQSGVGQDSSGQPDAGKESGNGEANQRPAGDKKEGRQDPAAGQQQGDSQPSGEKQKIDPETAPGDAMEEILKDRQKQEQGSGKQNRPEDQGKGEDRPQGEGEDKPGNQGDRENKSGAQPDSQQGEQGQKPRGEQAGDKQASPEKNDGQSKENSEKGQGAAGDQQGGRGDKQAAAGDKKEDGPGDNTKQGAEAGSDAQGGKSGDPEGDKGGRPESRSGEQSSDGKSPPNGSSSGKKEGGQKQEHAEKAGKQEGSKQEGSKQEGSGRQDEGTQRGDRQDGDAKGAEQRGTSSGGQKKPSLDQTKKSGDKAGETGQQSEPGAGKPSADDTRTPEAQEGNQDRQKKSGEATQESGQKDETPPAPSISKKQSDSQGDSSGDRSGGGQKGGGQQSKQQGSGGPGTNTPADEGGSKSDERGQGEIGTQPGDQKVTRSPTDSDQKQQAEGGKPSGSPADGRPESTAKNGQQLESGKTSSSQGSGAPGQQTDSKPNGQVPSPAAGGGKPADGQAGQSAEAKESTADEANLEYARRQTELALEHLRDQMAKDKPRLLDRLGWTKEDARRFLERWEGMKRAAAEKGEASDAARRQFKDALQSLGLRPRGTELQHGGVREQPQDARDTRRVGPPPDWADQFRAYSRGIAEPERRREPSSAEKTPR